MLLRLDNYGCIFLPFPDRFPVLQMVEQYGQSSLRDPNQCLPTTTSPYPTANHQVCEHLGQGQYFRTGEGQASILDTFRLPSEGLHLLQLSTEPGLRGKIVFGFCEACKTVQDAAYERIPAVVQ